MLRNAANVSQPSSIELTLSKSLWPVSRKIREQIFASFLKYSLLKMQSLKLKPKIFYFAFKILPVRSLRLI